MSNEFERLVEQTLAQASLSAPTDIAVPLRNQNCARRWLAPVMAAAAVVGIVATVGVLAVIGDSDKDPIATPPAKSSESACSPLDHTVQPSLNPNDQLTGETLASRLNSLALDFGAGVTMTYQPPDGFWLVVDDGQEGLIPELLRDVEGLKATNRVTIRESCVSQEQLRKLQEEIGSTYAHSGKGQVSTDLNLLDGRVEVFVSDREAGVEISQRYGALVHVKQVFTCALADCQPKGE